MLSRVTTNNRFSDNLLDNLFDNNFFFTPTYRSINSKPSAPVNVSENDKAFEIELSAPGLEKKDFKIELDSNILKISSKKVEDKPDQSAKYIQREIIPSAFERSFKLPRTVNIETINATYKNGILTLTLPKVKSETPKKMDIAIQ